VNSLNSPHYDTFCIIYLLLIIKHTNRSQHAPRLLKRTAAAEKSDEGHDPTRANENVARDVVGPHVERVCRCDHVVRELVHEKKQGDTQHRQTRQLEISNIGNK